MMKKDSDTAAAVHHSSFIVHHSSFSSV